VAGDSAQTQICPNCGEENPARFRLCGFCGTSLPAALPAQGVRKTVTIVFSDLKGSTSLGEALDSESLREVMLRYFEAMRVELERHNGTIEKYIGDAVMAVFGMPTIHEDDALRAVRAAAGMQRALAQLNEELERRWGVRLTNRTGVNTGEVVAADPEAGQRLVVGDAVNTAARLEQAAPSNEVLLGPLTYRLVRDAVEAEPVEPLELKGKAERLQAYRLLRLRAREELARPAGGKMVGRDAELALLHEAFRASIQDRTLHLVTLVGDAGIGKSRLTREFVASLGSDVLVARGRCLPYGEGITFWPLVEVAREAAGIREEDSSDQAHARLLGVLGDEDVVERISSAVGFSAAEFTLPELFWGFQRFIEILGEEQAVVLVIDDIHWAESTLLDLLEHILSVRLGAPALIVCTSRDDPRETRPSWGDDPNAQQCVLNPLTDKDASQIVQVLLGEAGLSDVVKRRVIQAAEGNPLFVEQMLAMLVDQGNLGRDGGNRATAGPAEVSVPPTIEALLAARLDALAREERAVVEPASVIGLTFPEAAVATMVPEPLRISTPAYMASLERKRLVHRDPATVGTDADLRFHHVLIRDAAYQRILKRTRARLHEQFVVWADGHNEERQRALESEEILGYHLEQAHRYLTELGPLDDHGRSVGDEGSRRLASAGHRAFARGDMPAAAGLLGRAAVLLVGGTSQRVTLLTDAAEAMLESGEWTLADEALERAIREARAADDAVGETNAHLVQMYLHYVTAGDRPEEVVQQAREAIVVLEAADDQKGLTRAWRTLTNVHFAGCRYLAAEDAAREMIQHARLAGDHAMEMRALPALATCAQLGPTPVPDAITVVEQILTALEGDRKSEAYTLRALGNLEAMRGRFPEARSMCQRSRATLDELGWRLDAALTGAIASGPVELLAEDPVAAEAELRHDYEALDAMGERNYISTTAALLAEALYRQDRHAEADRFSRISEDVAAEDDVTTQVLWRCVRGKVLARQGRFDDAETLAADAIRIIAGAEDPDTQGNAMLDLSEIRKLAGRVEEAVHAAEGAAALFGSKGNISSERRARAILTELVGEHPPAGST
jgi:class 3 adenylate cyclase/tetratricopeptide (TPR) repeat protein